jgi:DNA-directed RNA polymerase subunit RPC12/RpoP
MIIECAYCGAPLDVKNKDQSCKCNYCGTSNQVKTQRTVAFETPPGWRPPPQWQPPSHVTANSQQVLSYRKASSVTGLIVLLVVVGMLVVVGAITASVVSAVNTAARQVGAVNAQVGDATKQANDAIAQALAQASAAQAQADGMLGQVPQAAKAHPGLSPLSNAGVLQVLAAYKEVSGTSPLQVKSLTLHDTHSSVELQSAANPNQVDRYDYNAGRVRGPDPVRLIGSEKSNVKALLFDPEKAALGQVETLKVTAMGKLAYEEAKITHVIVERDHGKVVIRVYGGNDRQSGYVAFDARGKVTRVVR